MRKKSAPRRLKKPGLKKAFGHYIQFYFISVFVGVAVYIAAGFLLPSQPCANSKTCKTGLSEQVDNKAIGYFQGKTVIPPKINIAGDNTILPAVLGTTDPSEKKHIYVDLAAQKLYAYQGSKEVLNMLISSGRWGRTPVGNFSIWTKLRATRMAGGQGADAYNLPNVPYVMYFYHDFGLHGAYWHNNFGHKMSHGCVNLRIVDARDIFNWSEVGTPVSVCNTFTAPDKCEQ